jgi:hypothetical protein
VHSLVCRYKKEAARVEQVCNKIAAVCWRASATISVALARARLYIHAEIAAVLLVQALNRQGWKAVAVHGDASQAQRTAAVDSFKVTLARCQTVYTRLCLTPRVQDTPPAKGAHNPVVEHLSSLLPERGDAAADRDGRGGPGAGHRRRGGRHQLLLPAGAPQTCWPSAQCGASLTAASD